MIELLTLWAVFSGFFCLGRAVADEGRGYPFDEPKKGRIKTNLNAVALALNIFDYLKTVDYHKLITPKTPIQKEIEAEQKEIEIMEKLKVDIEKLDQLRERRKILFAETHEEELITANDVEPLKQPDAMEKRIRELINFSFDVQDKLLEERKKDFERVQREAEEEIDEVINHYKEKLDRREGDEQ